MPTGLTRRAQTADEADKARAGVTPEATVAVHGGLVGAPGRKTSAGLDTGPGGLDSQAPAAPGGG